MELIRFENVHKSFGNQRVYEGLSLSVFRGETLAVMGSSGSGKSVLLKTLIGLLEPDAGHVFFEGQEVSTMSDAQLRRLRRRVAMVFQGAALFDSLNVFDNVAYSLRNSGAAEEGRALRARVAEKLEWVNLRLSKVGHLMPSELSGGMAKRVGLARALAAEPEVILWDEPTAGLDPISRRVINTLIVSMKQRLAVTSVVVTHDLASAFAVSDRFALLSQRRIIAEGTLTQMRASKVPDVVEFLDESALETHP